MSPARRNPPPGPEPKKTTIVEWIDRRFTLVTKGIAISVFLVTSVGWVYSTIETNNAHNLKQEKQSAEILQQINKLNKGDLLIHETMKFLMAKSGACYWLSDSTGATIEVGVQSKSLVGRSESELLGYNWTTFIIPEDQQKVYNAISEALKRNTDFKCDFRMTKPDGSVVHVYAEAYRVINKENGKIINYIGQLQKYNEKTNPE